MTAFCFLFFAVLTIRSAILAFAEKKPLPVRAIDLFLALLFAAVTSALLLLAGPALSVSAAAIALVLLALLAIPAAFRLRKPYHRRTGLLPWKIVLVLAVLCLALISVMFTGFLRLTEDRPVLKLTMTGNARDQVVEWKPPEGTLQKQTLPAYEVMVETPEQTSIANLYIYGDQAAVKARVLRFQPWLNVIGIPNLCRIDYFYNGYTTAQRFNSMPHRAQDVTMGHPALQPFRDPFWNFWEGLYVQQTQSSWVKSATLESNYFPLVNPDGTPFRGSFYLTITPGGLSAVPLP